jgi:hypothetical protein
MPYNTAQHAYDFATAMEAGTLQSSGAFYAQNFARSLISTDNAIGTTGLMTCMSIPLHAGDTVSKASVIVGATAGATLTHKYFALYSNATVPLLLGQETDDTGAAMAANTVYTGTFATPVVIPSDGLYWVALCITGTTIPTLLGKLEGTVAAQNIALNTLFGNQGHCATSTGAASTAPATMASLTNLIVQPWVLLQ